MLIDPDFLTHWKTLTLCDLTGDEHAALYLIRLWGHCQTRRSDVFDIPPNGLKALCQFKGDADILESALTELGFISRDGKRVKIQKWSDHNAKLIQCWENGKKGGRPKTEPKRNRNETETKPKHDVGLSENSDPGNPPETNKIGGEKNRLSDKQTDKGNGVEKFGKFADMPELPLALTAEKLSDARLVDLVLIWWAENGPYVKERGRAGPDVGGAVVAFRAADIEPFNLTNYVATALHRGVAAKYSKHFMGIKELR